jgi:uncharacterized protein (TIGR02145 family)
MKNKLFKITLAATLGFAIVLTLSCSSGGDLDDNGGGGGNGNGGGQSNPGPSVTYEGETYQTVVIGTQTWMAKNLNYNAPGSKCYDDDEANCDKYGKLYNWATAMALPDCDYGTSCASQIGAKHRGICPNGWHIPSDAEWSTLTSYVGSNAGTKLKATSGWNSYSGVPAGTDVYGFAALPGGGGPPDGSFLSAGYNGIWWTSTEIDANYAYGRDLHYSDENASWFNGLKNFLRSVRCVQD